MLTPEVKCTGSAVGKGPKPDRSVAHGGVWPCSFPGCEKPKHNRLMFKAMPCRCTGTRIRRRSRTHLVGRGATRASSAKPEGFPTAWETPRRCRSRTRSRAFTPVGKRTACGAPPGVGGSLARCRRSAVQRCRGKCGGWERLCCSTTPAFARAPAGAPTSSRAADVAPTGRQFCPCGCRRLAVGPGCFRHAPSSSCSPSS